MQKLILAFLCVTIFSLNLTGCVDSYDIEKLAVVLAIGFDSNDSGITITAQILRNEPNSNRPKASIYVASAIDADSAIYKIRSSLGRKFIYSHLNCFIVGEALALKGITPLLDVTMRFNEIRPNVPLLITKGTAENILKAKIKDNPISSFSIKDELSIQQKLGYTAFSSNLDFAKSISNIPYVTSCSVVNIDNSYFNDTSNTEGVSAYTFPGNAIFKRDKLIGYLSRDEVHGFNLAQKNLQWGTFSIQTKDRHHLSFDLKQSNAKHSVYIKNGKLHFKIYVTDDVTIRVMSGSTDPNKDPNSLIYLQDSLNNTIKNQIDLAINASQKKLQVDIFDFGRLVYTTYPNEWKKIKLNWDKIYPTVPIEVVVASNIIQSGTISKSPFE